MNIILFKADGMSELKVCSARVGTCVGSKIFAVAIFHFSLLFAPRSLVYPLNHEPFDIRSRESISNVRVHLFEQLNEHNLILNYLESDLK
jgi:hypothetical protein